MSQGCPNSQDLLEVYHWLDSRHPHNLLPLESRLPDELECKSRDQYRIIMTMILAQANKDKHLTECLKLLFKRHPDFKSMKNLQKHEIKRLLGKKNEGGIGLGYRNPDRGGNGGRLWSFLECYFGVWRETITEANILTLYQKNGFKAGHFVKLLQAYYFDNNNVIPLDTPALNVLRDPLFPGYSNISDNQIRKDIEGKLRGEPGVSLIDFHEMLRFIGQTGGRDPKHFNSDDINVVIGWNAWRLLCSLEREEITKDWKWIYNHLVKNEGLAKDLWLFYRNVLDQ
jgi:hypothetical protein